MGKINWWVVVAIISAFLWGVAVGIAGVRAMRINELPDFPAAGVVLHCLKCGQDSSATRADYWYNPNASLMCCGQPTELMRKVMYYEAVSAEEASDEPTN